MTQCYIKNSVVVVLSLIAGYRIPETTSNMNVSGGIVVGKDQAPSVVLLDMPNNTICTGTFLNQSMVLTAAHCIYAVAYAEVSGVRSINSYLAASNFKELYAAAKAHVGADQITTPWFPMIKRS